MVSTPSVSICDQFHPLFHALRLHFNTESYDIFKYKGRVKNLPEHCPSNLQNTYLKIHKKFPTQRDFAELFVANRIKAKIEHPTGLLDTQAIQVHSQWKSRVESLSYRFKSEIKSDDFSATIKGIMAGNITLESGVIHQILADVNDVEEFYLKPVLSSLIKYRPFLQVWKCINEQNLESCRNHINNLK